MVAIGVDAHKRVHAALALDDAGHVLGQWRGPNTPSGWHTLQQWAAAFPGLRQWGIEGAWNYGRGLAQHLVSRGETVYEINPRWTAQRRRRARRPGKSDTLDAHAVARLVREEQPALPRVTADDETAVLAVLVSQRSAALAEATRLRNQRHQLLLQLDPSYALNLPALTSHAGVQALAVYPLQHDSVLNMQRAVAIRRLAQRLQLVLDHTAALTTEIEALAQRHYAPLTQLCGVSLLTAGMLASILGPGQRCATDAQLAAYAGVAPLEASSADLVRHRLNRGGNRQLNAILYRIVLVQARTSPQAQAYLARRQAQGKTRREALRALKRYLIRAIWRLWRACAETVEAAYT
jgi:transposase